MTLSGWTAQDFATWIQVVLSAITIVVLILAWRAANAQAKAAESQAEAAKLQATAAEQLIVITDKQRASSEVYSAGLIRAAGEQSALIEAQLKETLHPLLVFEQGGGVVTALPCTIGNQGSGMALDISWWYGKAGTHPRFDQPLSATILGPGHLAKTTVNIDKAQSEGMTIQYRSTDGRLFQTFIDWTDGRCLQVQHKIEPS